MQSGPGSSVQVSALSHSGRNGKTGRVYGCIAGETSGRY